MKARSLPGRLALALVLLAPTACSTTSRLAANLRGTSEFGANNPGGSTFQGQGNSPTQTTTGSGTTGGPSGVVSSMQGGSAISSGRPAGGSVSGPGRAGGTGSTGRIPVGRGTPGVSDTTLNVGIWTLNSSATNAAESSLTGNPSQVFSPNTDLTAAAQAVIDYINGHGAVAGRKLVGVFHQVNVANLVTQSGRDQEEASACADWTQDHHVFAMMTVPGAPGSFDCAKSTNTVLLSDQFAGGQEPVDQSRFSQMANLWYAPNSLLEERREADLASTLIRQGFFPSGSTVGIMEEANPDVEYGISHGMLPVLAAQGIHPVVIAYPDIVNSSWSNYVLQLETQHVDHVIMSGTTGQYWASLFMMKTADTEHYYPHWGIATDNAPVALNIEGAPTDELQNTQGMGWIPGVDVGSADVQSSNTAVCEQLEKSSGQGTAVAVYCESLLFLAYVLNRATEVSPSGMSAALGSIGSGYPSVYTLGGKTQFSPTNHTGPVVEQDFVYDPHCGQSGYYCFQYTGPRRTLP